jgi:cytochrome c oxidase subunit 3
MTQPPPIVAPQFDNAEQQAHAATLAVWIFLATELLFFGPLFFGYLYGRSHHADAFALAGRHTDIVLGSVNTLLLLTSSGAMAAAVQARKFGDGKLTVRLLGCTALLGMAFLVLKGMEYTQDWQRHLIPGAGFSIDGAENLHGGAELFFLLYFAMTGLHAIHLIIGIVITGFFALALRQNASVAASAERLELIGLYWHFVDVVWIFLYPMLYLLGRAGG